VRMLTRGRDLIDAAFFARRVERALAYRGELFPGARAYRLIATDAAGNSTSVSYRSR